MDSVREACRLWPGRKRLPAEPGAGGTSRCPAGRIKSVRDPVRLCPRDSAAAGSVICPCEKARWWPGDFNADGRDTIPEEPLTDGEPVKN